MNYPTVKYPTIIEGKVWAPRLRLESLDGPEIWIKKPPDINWEKYTTDNLFFKDGCFYLKNLGTIQINGLTYCVTHLQKESTKGYLIIDPYCVHRWYFWKLQEPCKPGTERGIYMRTPLWPIGCWRWQNDKQEPWVRSKGIISGHWD